MCAAVADFGNYEDWKDKPIETIRDLLTFLEVDPNYTPDMSVKHNTSPVVYKYPQLYKLLRELIQRKLVGDQAQKDLIQRTVLESGQ